ncbi:DUF6503 family protein [Zeaxanthinibacter enoshimensis]|uniref:Outer membrane lipoprotein-sorting protein n=1 Tax=Zeaxanthinibacter enoshimensis TaxID=392009 RepID=A0A4R6TJ61_9FLAO|nr:DUF6503 family protein [Zeaxanthinibacter enoshimensis]TDQ29320.1 hypothetical protein CLV82_2776 [Zeaxanthinibacter enoshimensis]
MRLIFTFVILLLFGISCKDSNKQTRDEGATSQDSVTRVDKSYPEALEQVFEAHGGLDMWELQRTLRFTITRNGNKEVHTIDLQSRKDRVDAPEYSMGSDGENVWLLDPEGKYEGDPVFYHNLMFYFYAMPYVLADEGIRYSEAEPLKFGDKEYKGFRIQYEAGVGVSPEDEYYLYYDPDTMRMQWLGYTVTYGKDGPSDDVHWIRYDDWQLVNGVYLPASVAWYNYEEGKPTEMRNRVIFEEVNLRSTPLNTDFFARPPDAEVVKQE